MKTIKRLIKGCFTLDPNEPFSLKGCIDGFAFATLLILVWSFLIMISAN